MNDVLYRLPYFNGIAFGGPTLAACVFERMSAIVHPSFRFIRNLRVDLVWMLS